MGKKQTVSGKQAQKLYLALREVLGQSLDGQQLLAAFEADPEAGSAALGDYLRQQLSQDEALTSRLAGSLESQFTTIVTGGQVDQIINVARLGALHLTQERRFAVFGSVRQVVAFLGVIVLVGAAVAFGVWYLAQPRPLKGQFNIAVAEFAEIPYSPYPRVAPIASQRIFDFLESEYKLTRLGSEVDIVHEKIGVIADEEEARKLAQSINADVVIYGDVTLVGDKAAITLKFYVADSYRPTAGELTGAHPFALPTEFEAADIIGFDSDVNTALRQRTAILIDFTAGLAYFAANDRESALGRMKSAIRRAEPYGDFEGKEVLYLLAAESARLMGDFPTAQGYVDQALRINPSYGRARIAQGLIHYSKGLVHYTQGLTTCGQYEFILALRDYDEAAGLADQPPSAYIIEKANLFRGHVNSYQYQVADDGAEKATLAAHALAYYQAVIHSYESAPQPLREHSSLRELAAWAYGMSGIVYYEEGRWGESLGAYWRALELTRDPEVSHIVRPRLEKLIGKVLWDCFLIALRRW